MDARTFAAHRPALAHLSLSALASSALMLIALLLPAVASAAAGEPDPSFGTAGFTLLDEPSLTNEGFEDVLALPDGRILAGGDRGGSSGFLLARFNPDGRPDLGFGADGIKVEPDFEAEPGLGTPGSPRSISSMELRGDGKIVVAGLGRGLGKVNAFQFARYLPNGELDPSFGADGMATVWFEPSGDAHAMAQAPDGKLVATGDNGSGGVAVVARVTEEGNPDGTFHPVTPAGVRFVDVPGSATEEGLAVRVLGNRTVLIGGYASNGAFLAELQEDGEPATSFGTAGIAVHDLGDGAGPSGEINDLALLPDGRILAVGSAEAADGQQAVVARFTASGELDPSFANGGIFKANPTPGSDEAYALEVLADGRILVAGRRGGADTWLLRLNADGRRDATFGANGEAFASASPGSEIALGLAMQGDGKAVVAGEAEVGTASQLMVGRFTGDAPPAEPTPSVRLKCAGKRATIVGTNRNDVIAGTQHADVIVALKGNDKVRSRNGDDLVCGGPGQEVIKTGRGEDIARGEGGRDILTGGIGRDLLLGGSGGDRLYGGAGNDRLLAGAGNDRLVGSKGRHDLCNGGAGPRDHARGGCELLRKVP